MHVEHNGAGGQLGFAPSHAAVMKLKYSFNTVHALQAEKTAACTHMSAGRPVIRTCTALPADLLDV
jgi:hypothetical protein